MKRLFAMILVFAMTISLAACKAEDDTKNDTEDKGIKKAELGATIHVPEYIELNGESEPKSLCASGENIFISTSERIMRIYNTDGEMVQAFSGEEYPEKMASDEYDLGFDEFQLYRMPLEGGKLEKLEEYQPPALPDGTAGSCHIEQICAGENGTLWVLEVLWYRVLPKGVDPSKDNIMQYMGKFERQVFLRQLDSTGREQKKIVSDLLQKELENEHHPYIKSMFITEEDGFCFDFGHESKIILLDKEGNGDFSLPYDTNTVCIIQFSDKTIACCKLMSNIRLLDTDNKEWTWSSYSLPGIITTWCSGSGKYLFYYSVNDNFMGWNQETNKGEKIFSWSDVGIDSSSNQVYSMPNGALAVIYKIDISGKYELALLKEADTSVYGDKVILVYGTMRLTSELKKKVVAFNRTSTHYHIQVKDYSVYNTGENANAGWLQFLAEAGAGQFPDIVDTKLLSPQRYGTTGFLENLWPYIDKDPDIRREDLMERVFEAAETEDGKLYYIFGNFGIRTLAGAQEVIGDRTGWTLEDMAAALEIMPDDCTYFGNSLDKDGAVSDILAPLAGDFIDWEKRKCYFTSDEFIRLLEFCNTFPAQRNDSYIEQNIMDALQDGRQMLYDTSLAVWEDFQKHDLLFGKKAAYIGYPTIDGIFGSFFVTYGCSLAMSSTCTDKEGAWSFMRELLLPDEDKYETLNKYDILNLEWFPTNKTNFQRCFEKASEEKGEDETIGHVSVGDMEVEVQPATQAQYDQLMKLYNSTNRVYDYDTDITSVLQEIAGSYFNGDRTAQEAAELIQNRIQLYVNEMHR